MAVDQSAADPYFDAGLRGWIVNVARKHLHRLKNYDLEDLVQEGYLCYCKCRNRYIGSVQNVGHHHYLPADAPSALDRRRFMALVKSAFIHRITDLVRLSKRSPATDPVADEKVFERLLPPEPEVATLMALLTRMPAELTDLVTRLISDAVLPTQVRCFRYRSRTDRFERIESDSALVEREFREFLF